MNIASHIVFQNASTRADLAESQNSVAVTTLVRPTPTTPVPPIPGQPAPAQSLAHGLVARATPITSSTAAASAAAVVTRIFSAPPNPAAPVRDYQQAGAISASSSASANSAAAAIAPAPFVGTAASSVSSNSTSSETQSRKPKKKKNPTIVAENTESLGEDRKTLHELLSQVLYEHECGKETILSRPQAANLVGEKLSQSCTDDQKNVQFFMRKREETFQKKQHSLWVRGEKVRDSLNQGFEIDINELDMRTARLMARKILRKQGPPAQTEPAIVEEDIVEEDTDSQEESSRPLHELLVQILHEKEHLEKTILSIPEAIKFAGEKLKGPFTDGQKNDQFYIKKEKKYLWVQRKKIRDYLINQGFEVCIYPTNLGQSRTALRQKLASASSSSYSNSSPVAAAALAAQALAAPATPLLPSSSSPDSFSASSSAAAYALKALTHLPHPKLAAPNPIPANSHQQAAAASSSSSNKRTQATSMSSSASASSSAALASSPSNPDSTLGTQVQKRGKRKNPLENNPRRKKRSAKTGPTQPTIAPQKGTKDGGRIYLRDELITEAQRRLLIENLPSLYSVDPLSFSATAASQTAAASGSSSSSAAAAVAPVPATPFLPAVDTTLQFPLSLFPTPPSATYPQTEIAPESSTELLPSGLTPRPRTPAALPQSLPVAPLPPAVDTTLQPLDPSLSSSAQQGGETPSASQYDVASFLVDD